MRLIGSFVIPLSVVCVIMAPCCTSPLTTSAHIASWISFDLVVNLDGRAAGIIIDKWMTLASYFPSRWHCRLVGFDGKHPLKRSWGFPTGVRTLLLSSPRSSPSPRHAPPPLLLESSQYLPPSRWVPSCIDGVALLLSAECQCASWRFSGISAELLPPAVD